MAENTEYLALWGGRFTSGPSPELARLSKSTQFDWRLADDDIAGSRAHARALGRAGLLTADELSRMEASLDELQRRVDSGAFAPIEDDEDEATQSFVKKYQEKYGETPIQFAADAYDCVYAYKLALETAGCTPDMSAADLNAKMKETFPTITFTGLTGDGAGITWDATGAVSKSPKGMVIQNGAYAGMD